MDASFIASLVNIISRFSRSADILFSSLMLASPIAIYFAGRYRLRRIFDYLYRKDRQRRKLILMPISARSVYAPATPLHMSSPFIILAYSLLFI